jgi:hypothetical protein
LSAREHVAISIDDAANRPYLRRAIAVQIRKDGEAEKGRPGNGRRVGAKMDKVQQMGAARPEDRQGDEPRRVPQARESQMSQQAGGAQTPRQMQATQFKDWASI